MWVKAKNRNGTNLVGRTKKEGGPNSWDKRSIKNVVDLRRIRIKKIKKILVDHQDISRFNQNDIQRQGISAFILAIMEEI